MVEEFFTEIRPDHNLFHTKNFFKRQFKSRPAWELEHSKIPTNLKIRNLRFKNINQFEGIPSLRNSCLENLSSFHLGPETCSASLGIIQASFGNGQTSHGFGIGQT